MKNPFRTISLWLTIALVCSMLTSPVGAVPSPSSAPPTLEKPPKSARASQPASGAAQPLAYRKVIAPPHTLDTSREGVALWHDYGAFALYKVSPRALSRLSDAARSKIQLPQDMDNILLDVYPFNTQVDTFDPIPDRLRVTQPDGPALHLIQFVGPLKDQWLQAVRKVGATPIHYVANYGYLVWADVNARARLSDMAHAKEFVQFSAPYQPYFKLGVSLNERLAEDCGVDSRCPEKETVTVTIQMYDHAGKEITQKLIDGLLREQISPWTSILDYENLTGQVRVCDLETIAAQPDVFWIGEYLEPERLDEVQGQILAGNLDAAQSGPSSPGYLSWLDSYGLSPDPDEYPVVDIADDGIGNGTVSSGDYSLHELGDISNPTRLQYVGNCTSEASGGGPDGHGHINASIVGGYDVAAGFPYRDPNGFNRGLGVSPYGRIAGTRVFDDSGGFDTSACGGSYSGLIKAEQDAGAQISSNSWGCSGCAGTYDASSQAFDVGVRDADLTEPGNQELIFVFAAGNDGPGAGTVGTPGNGKNMITVGASENDRSSDEDGDWTDGCGVGPTEADNAMDVVDFSSRGPAPGGRVKPEVIAPGTHIQGTASTHSSYNGSGVCDQYRPSGQTIFAASSGTSHSTPAVAGVISLYYHWLENEYGITPSPALMKAYLIAHPTYLTGVDANDDLPSYDQGYGMPNLTLGFDGALRYLLNQTEIFDNTGEDWIYSAQIADPGKPVRVVLAYTDEAGAIGASPEVNNLDLEVTVGGETYLGNNFSGQWSVSGGSADADNNYEAVFLPAGASGQIDVRIIASNIAGDGVPNVGDATDQDFALVVYNASQGPVGTLEGAVYEAGGAPGTDPIADVTVRATASPTLTFATTTDATGAYDMRVPSDTYTLDAQKYGYRSAQISGVSVSSDVTTTQNMSMTIASSYVVSGTVVDSSTDDPLWASIYISGDPFDPPTTTLKTDPATGHYSLTLAEDITYTFDVASALHVPTTTVLAPLTGDTALNFALNATTQEGVIAGWVRDYYTDDPIEGATVAVDGVVTPTMTDADGYFESVTMPAGFYTATASADLYSSVTITEVEVVTSNVALLTYRLPTPRLEHEPTALSKVLTMGQTLVDTPGLVITNTGAGDLDWELIESPGGFMSTPSLCNSGGPDTFGYVYRDSDEPDGPTFKWVDVESSGTSVALGDDGSGGPFSIGFTFNFYGNDYTEFYVNSNGVIKFDTGFSSPVNQCPLPSFSAPNDLIALLWDDLDPGDTGDLVYYHTFASCPYGVGSCLVVQYENYHHYPGGGDIAGTFEVILFDNGNILIQFEDAGAEKGSGSTTGIENSDGSDGLTYDSCNTIDSLKDELSICYQYPGAPPCTGGDVPWLAEDPVSGALAYSASQSIEITWDAAGPEVDQPGAYYARLLIGNNDPLAQGLQIPVTMTVLPSPTLGLLSGHITSSGYCDSNPYAIDGAEVYLEGSGGYTYTLFSGDDEQGWADGYYQRWLEAGESPFTVTVAYPEHPTTTVTGVSLSAGLTTTQNFSLRWQQPCVSVAPDAISATLDMGLSVTVPLSISNAGAIALDFELREKDEGFAPTLAAPLVGEDVLVVSEDDDAAGAMETALTSLGYTFLDIENAAFTAMTVDDLLAYQAVFYAGIPSSGSEQDRAMAYMDAGGSFLTADGDIGFNYYGTTFYRTYLQATYVSDDPYTDTLNGEDIMAGLTLDISADSWPDDFTVGAEGMRIFRYSGGNAAGVAVERSGYRAIYLSFDFDSIASGANEEAVVSRAMGFLAATDVTWLSEDPISGTLTADGGSALVDVTLDAAQVTQPGSYRAALRVGSNDPVNRSMAVPVTMTVNAPSTWGKLEGVVSSLGHCDVSTATLEGAAVLIEDIEGDDAFSLTTDASGVYAIWLDAATYTVTASYAGHAAKAETATITAQTTSGQDFYLRSLEPCVSVAPLSMESTLSLGRCETLTLTIGNDGAAASDFVLHEKTGTPIAPTVHIPSVSIPADDGRPSQGSGPSSVERAPASVEPNSTVEPTVSPLGPGSPAYGVDLSNGYLYNWPDVDAPGVWNTVGATGISDPYAGDYAGNDFSILYVIDDDSKQLYAVDTATGVGAVIGPCAPDPGQTWTGMAWDPTTAVMYASATDGITATLFTVDLSTGAPTAIGAITGGQFTIDIAVDLRGQMYGVDIDADSLIAIDKNTGAAAIIGALGFDADYAQGMDFDEDTGILYLAAFNSTTSAGELRIADTNTGGATLVGAFPGGAEIDSFAFPTGGEADVPWLAEAPISGAVGVESLLDVGVTFTAWPTMTIGVYTATLIVDNDDAVNGWIRVPVTLTIRESPEPAWDKQVYVNGALTDTFPIAVREGDVVEIVDTVEITYSEAVTFTLTEGWGDSLALAGYTATDGLVVTNTGVLTWTVRGMGPTRAYVEAYVITKTFAVLAGAWESDAITESLWVENAFPQLEDRVIEIARLYPGKIYLPLVLRNYGAIPDRGGR